MTLKKGLILEGGAMRCMFSAGIMDVMLENNIEFDGAIGVSAGAAFGCNYKSKQIGRTLRYNLKYSRDKRYCSFYSLVTTGNLFGAEFCYHELPEKLDQFDAETFAKNPMEFYIVCTDVETAKPVYKKCEDVGYESMEWIRASASLPLMAEIVEIDGMKLMDGGITDTVPLKYFQSIGYEKNIVILTQPKGFVKKKTGFMRLIKAKLKKYPDFVKAIENRHHMYNDTLAYVKQQEEKGNVLVLRPEEALPINRMEKDPKVLQEVYDKGREVGMKYLDEIKEFLE